MGHRFYDIDGNIIVCTNIIHNQIVSDCYSIITKNNGNCYTNSILSKTPDPFDGYFETIYKLESDIEYRNEMIEKYGIFTYSQTNGLVTEEVYEKFYIKYFNIFLGLGLITEEDINGILLLGEDIIYLS